MAKNSAIDSWMDAKSPQELQFYKSEILACSAGCDIDHDTMYEDLDIRYEEHPPDFDPTPLWFDHCIKLWTEMFAIGQAEIYRAISVQCKEAFCQKIPNISDFGRHWTWDIGCADTCYHSEHQLPHEILLKATVKTCHVDWPTTLQQSFAHGNEREITVEGIVDLLEVQCFNTNQVFWKKS